MFQVRCIYDYKDPPTNPEWTPTKKRLKRLVNFACQRPNLLTVSQNKLYRVAVWILPTFDAAVQLRKEIQATNEFYPTIREHSSSRSAC